MEFPVSDPPSSPGGGVQASTTQRKQRASRTRDLKISSSYITKVQTGDNNFNNIFSLTQYIQNTIISTCKPYESFSEMLPILLFTWMLWHHGYFTQKPLTIQTGHCPGQSGPGGFQVASTPRPHAGGIRWAHWHRHSPGPTSGQQRKEGQLPAPKSHPEFAQGQG